jgi:hypothetical protein
VRSASTELRAGAAADAVRRIRVAPRRCLALFGGPVIVITRATIPRHENKCDARISAPFSSSRSRVGEPDLHKDLHSIVVFRRLLAAAIAVLAFAIVAVRVCHIETDAIARVFCVALMLSMALALSVASGRAAFGTFCTSLIAGLAWLGSTLKLNYLHEPLMAPDLRYLAGTLTQDVIGHYPGMLRKCVVAIVGGIALAIVLWRLESPGLWRRGGARRRVLATIFAAIPLSLCLWPQGAFRDVYATPTWDFISAVDVRAFVP